MFIILFLQLKSTINEAFIFNVLCHIILLSFSYWLYGYNSTKRKRPVWARIDVDYRNQWWVYFIFGLCQAVFMRIRRMMILCTVSASKRPWLTNLLLLFSLCILCQKKPNNKYMFKKRNNPWNVVTKVIKWVQTWMYTWQMSQSIIK